MVATRPPADPPEEAMPDWLRLRARATPDRLALCAGSIRWSFADLDRRADRAARQLATLGVGPGVRVALLIGNGAPFVVLTHALARRGAVMVPLNLRLAAEELRWQAIDARAQVLVCDRGRAAAAAMAGGSVAHIALAEGDGLYEAVHLDAVPQEGNLADAIPSIPEAGDPPAGVRLSAAQGIIYTSATSGRPKGVLLTFGNHWWSAVASALHLGTLPGDRWLAVLPFYHVGGLAILWRSIICGIPAIVHEAFDPDATNRAIHDEQVTHLSLVGTMLPRILDAHAGAFPSSLRCILVGGGPVSPALVDACLRRRVPIAPTYGLTEAASQVTTLLPAEVPERRASAGRPLWGVDVAIENAETGALPPGEVGDIVVRGPTVMRGYADRPEETARAVRGGWLHTGDLGYLDEAGYLHVVDRRDDLIISGGENVYPAEVERVLLEHPAVADAGAVGLPDPLWGQVVAAVLQVRATSSVNEEEIKAFCAGRLARYKIPKYVWFVDALPRSAAGKLSRRALREWVITREQVRK